MDAKREIYSRMILQTISMEFKRVGLFIVFFVHLFVNRAASYPQNPPPKTDYFPQNDSKDEMGMKQNREIDRPFGHATDSAGKGENDGSDGSRSLQVKANFIPIYAAGAARQRHGHGRSSSSCLRSSAGLSSVAGAVTLASLLHLYIAF